MTTPGIGAIYHRSEPVRITLDEMAQWWERPSADGGERLVSCTVAARIGGRTVVSQDLPPAVAERFRGCGLLDAPVHLGLCAVFEAARDRGLLHVQVSATATGPEQEEILAELVAEFGEDSWFWSVPWSTVGLHLGTAYLPAPSTLLTRIPPDGRVRERLLAREDALKPYFDRVLWGDPGRAVDRLIRSIRRTRSDDLQEGAR